MGMRRFWRRCVAAFSEVSPEQMPRAQQKEAAIERIKHAAIVEEHAAWVMLQNARIARVQQELKAIEQAKKETTE